LDFRSRLVIDEADESFRLERKNNKYNKINKYSFNIANRSQFKVGFVVVKSAPGNYFY